MGKTRNITWDWFDAADCEKVMQSKCQKRSMDMKIDIYFLARKLGKVCLLTQIIKLNLGHYHRLKNFEDHSLEELHKNFASVVFTMAELKTCNDSGKLQLQY